MLYAALFVGGILIGVVAVAVMIIRAARGIMR